VTLRTNFGRYARVPTLGELHGVSSVVQGNPALGAERGSTADVGASVQVGDRRLGASLDGFVFVRRAEDLVAYRQNAVGVIVPYNVGNARILGAELAAGLTALGFLRDDLAVTLLDARDTTPTRVLRNDYLPYRPRLVVMNRLEAVLRGDERSSLSSGAVGVRIMHRASRYADPAGLLVIPHQTTFDLEARASAFHDAVTLRAAVRNVFDVPEVDTIGLPLPGRSFHVTLEGTTR
jgi:iron complex outermembrane receptor protein